MSGRPGRSGGHNKKSRRLHALHGTRVRPSGTAGDAQARLAVLEELAAVHVARARRHEERIAEHEAQIAAGRTIDGSRLYRSSRQEAQLAMSLTLAAHRLAQDVPAETENDEFSAFDQIEAWANRRRGGNHKGEVMA